MRLKCRNCGRALGNPLTHRCVSRTDYKRRKRAADKPRRPAPGGDGHEYASCDDDDCQRFPCRVYKEGRAAGKIEGFQLGYAAGYVEGFEEGYKQGYGAGYGAGFDAGLASCPGPHGG